MESLSLNPSSNGTAGLPIPLEKASSERLEPGESVLAWLETDLDQTLRYGQQFVALTNRRLLAFTHVDGNLVSNDSRLGRDTLLKVSENGPVGTLEVVNPAGQLAHWRYTVRQAAAARRPGAKMGESSFGYAAARVGLSVLRRGNLRR